MLTPEPARLPILSLIGAMAVGDAIRTLSGLTVSVKWPNDLLLQNRKVAGLLVETISRPRQPPWALLGLGLNLFQGSEDFPGDLKTSAVSLRQASGRRIPRAQALAAFLECLQQRLHQSPDEILGDIRVSLVQLGRTATVRVGHETLTGIAEKMDEAGRLHLRLPSGEVQVLSSGETDFPA